MTSTPSFTILNWRNEDAILNVSAFAVQATTTGTGTTNNGNVPGEGPGCASGSGLPAFPPCVYGPQGFTNATFTATGGKIHFLSQFLYADLILNNQIKTGLSRFPLNLLLDYENNLNAADHPLDAKGKPTNLGKQSHGHLVDVSLGQTTGMMFNSVMRLSGRSRTRSFLHLQRASSARSPISCNIVFSDSGRFVPTHCGVYDVDWTHTEQQSAARRCGAWDSSWDH
jgi:hypothetical protein